MTPAEKARALLDTHHGLGASKRELGAHILAYERVVPALLDALDAQRAAGGCARDQRTTQFCAEAVAKDAEIARLTSELAAAQTGPVVEWRQKGLDVHEAHRNAFLLSVSITGWRLLIWTKHHNFIPVDSGPETGQEGKVVCVAAYYRATGATTA